MTGIPAETPADYVAPATPAGGTTHVLVAVDESGSMWRLADDTRGGYNSFLANLATTAAGPVLVSVLKFSDNTTVLYTATALADAPRLDDKNYQPGGNTALYDAVGQLITEFERSTVLGAEDRVMLVVLTDGRENSSREYVATDVQQMVSEREKSGRWMTAYLGAGMAAWDGGAALGMRSVNTTRDSHGTRSAYSGLSEAATTYSRGGSRQETFDVLERSVREGGQ